MPELAGELIMPVYMEFGNDELLKKMYGKTQNRNEFIYDKLKKKNSCKLTATKKGFYRFWQGTRSCNI